MIKEPLYNAIKIRERSIKRLTDIEDYAYKLYMSNLMSSIDYRVKENINNAMLQENECIRLCDKLLTAYYN